MLDKTTHAVTESDVITFYRIMLGREPEGPEAIAPHLQHGSAAELLAAIASSEEYQRRINPPGSGQPYLTAGTGNLYVPTEVFAGTYAGEYMPASIPLASDFMHPEFSRFLEGIRHPFQIHRKIWEFAYIAHHLERMGALGPGKRGLCFGAGEEPLPAFFAKRGSHIVATDAPAEIVLGKWIETAQHSDNIGKLAKPEIIDNKLFTERVTFEPCDMNAISPHLKEFDFCWSACCLEHLGSLRHGLDFIINSVEKTLKIGGVACHTTELNLSSNEDTLESEHMSLFRRRDLEELIEDLRRRGHEVLPLVVTPGATPIDHYIDLPPYLNDPHLKLRLGGFVSTSVGIVVRRGR
ncbi:MAG TPA: hypothetical protein VEZ16_00080 [Microvirga sp.]|nr:hypothetical protein [Microvirga sp.]